MAWYCWFQFYFSHVADNNWCFDCRWGTQNRNYEEV